MSAAEGRRGGDPIDRIRRLLFLVPALALLFLFLATPVPPRTRRPSPPPATSRLEVHPLGAREAPPGGRIGALTLLRGWELRSGERRFGGISAMSIDAGRVTALSDAGSVLRFALPARPGAIPVHAASLSRHRFAEKTSLDAEALVRHQGRHWLAFESANAIVRYGPDGRPEAWQRPRAMRSWGGNSGPEAMVRLGDGSFLVFSEGRSDRRFSPVILFAGDPTDPTTASTTLRYQRPRGYRVTDAALLPDGRVLLLNRRVDLFAGMSALLIVIDVARLRPNATLRGRVVARLESPWAVDNMEALAVTREGGETIVRIASDDNFMALQRTLLLEFRLDEARTRAPPRL